MIIAGISPAWPRPISAAFALSRESHDIYTIHNEMNEYPQITPTKMVPGSHSSTRKAEVRKSEVQGQP